MSMWIESHQSLRNHPKVRKSARLAGINEFEMIGRLHAFWWWAMDYAPTGDVTKYTNEDIEDAVDWGGESGKFANALIDCGLGGHSGFIEVTSDGQRLIHDWDEYGGRLLDLKEANRERMRARRARHVSRTTAAQPPHDRGLPNQQDKQDQPNNTEKPLSPDGDAPQSEAPKTREKTPRDLAVAELEKKFSALSRLPVPIRQTDKQKKAAASLWWNPLGEIWELCDQDVGRAYTLIEKTYRQMHHEKLTISDPNSILKTARALNAQNGHKPEKPVEFIT